MTNPEAVTAVVAVLALIGSVLGFARARSADRKADAASKRAAAAEDSANDARTRAAAALERANEIAELQLPSAEPAWEVEAVSGSRYVAWNRSPGKGTARNALVEGAGEAPHKVMPEETVPRDVPAGDGLAFLVSKAMGPRPVVRVSHEGADGERVSEERVVY